MKFCGTKPCNTCPYLRKTPLKYWDVYEFKNLLDEDKEQFGKTFGCHKKDDTVCRGWLINQESRGLPNINLRILLLKEKIDRKYLDQLVLDDTMYQSIEEMAKANFPEIIK